MAAGVSITVALQMPEADSKITKPLAEKQPVEEQVREALDKIESGEDSHAEWLFINSVYKKLQGLKKPSKRAISIKKMIEPVLAHYGYHMTSSNNGAK